MEEGGQKSGPEVRRIALPVRIWTNIVQPALLDATDPNLGAAHAAGGEEIVLLCFVLFVFKCCVSQKSRKPPEMPRNKAMGKKPAVFETACGGQARHKPRCPLGRRGGGTVGADAKLPRWCGAKTWRPYGLDAAQQRHEGDPARVLEFSVRPWRARRGMECRGGLALRLAWEPRSHLHPPIPARPQCSAGSARSAPPARPPARTPATSATQCTNPGPQFDSGPQIRCGPGDSGRPPPGSRVVAATSASWVGYV